jgi:hypothetical protein
MSLTDQAEIKSCSALNDKARQMVGEGDGMLPYETVKGVLERDMGVLNREVIVSVDPNLPEAEE